MQYLWGIYSPFVILSQSALGLIYVTLVTHHKNKPLSVSAVSYDSVKHDGWLLV